MYLVLTICRSLCRDLVNCLCQHKCWWNIFPLFYLQEVGAVLTIKGNNVSLMVEEDHASIQKYHSVWVT